MGWKGRVFRKSFPALFPYAHCKKSRSNHWCTGTSFQLLLGPALLSFYRIFGAFLPSCMMLDKVLTDG